ncbi:MAG: hypothetical protein QM784_16195 [Polyangiaceae bacterium]
MLDDRRVLFRARGQHVHVQFESVGTGLLDPLGIVEPPGIGHAVERTNDGDFDRGLHLSDLFEILVRTEEVIGGFREESESLGVGVLEVVHVCLLRRLFEHELLLEQ